MLQVSRLAIRFVLYQMLISFPGIYDAIKRTLEY